MQQISRRWYHNITPRQKSCKIRFEMENIFDKPVFVQYYEGCLMWIDIASYVES